MVSVASTTVNSVKMVVDAVVECFEADPTDVSSATAMNMVTSINLLYEDTAIGTPLDVRVALRPPLQQQLLTTLRSGQRVLLASQPTMGRPVTV